MIRESQIEQYLVDSVDFLGGMCWKTTAQGRRGIPDRYVMLPEGKHFWVEVKRADGKLAPVQIRVHNKMKNLGVPVYTVYSYEDVDNVLGV